MTTPTAPTLTDLLTRPREFFSALRTLPPATSRYLWLVVLTGLVTGLYSFVAQKPVQDAMQSAFRGLPGMPGGALSVVFTILGALLTSLLLWLILWALGNLGAGREGRAAEVFGATFLPTLIASLLLLPVAALFPLHIHTPAPNLAGLEGVELQKAVQTYSFALQKDVGGQPLSVIGKVLTYGAMAWQFYLAWVGFGVLTADRQKALRGTLLPLVVVLLVAGAFWLLGRAVGGMMG